MLLPHGTQTLTWYGPGRNPVPYVDRRSGKPWPSHGIMPFSNAPTFHVPMYPRASKAKAKNNISVAPGSRSLALVGSSPIVAHTVTINLSPGSRAMALAGDAPTAVKSSPELSPDAQSLALAGATPSVVSTDQVLTSVEIEAVFF